MENEIVITLTADIVSAHVANNSVAVEQLPVLIGSVYAALNGLGKEPAVADAVVLTPAVTIRSSVKRDSVTCLDCGFKAKMLKRHLASEHGLTPQDYKARWKLPADYPLVAPEYAETRKALALKIGLGRKPGVKHGRTRKARSAS